MPVVALTATQQLDAPVGVRAESIRWDLLDQSFNKLGSLAVDRQRLIPEIVNDVNSAIRRKVNNWRLLPRALANKDSALFHAGEVNIVSQRVRPSWILGAGGPGYEFPLGVFLWGNDSQYVHTYGNHEDCTLVDQCTILNQPITQSLSYPVGTNIATALNAAAAAAGLTAVSIDSSALVTTAPFTWLAGAVTQLAVMEALCAAGGYYAPYFDNNGTLRCRIAPNLATASPDLTYLMGSRMLPDTIMKSSDLLIAPNRYIVVDNSATTAPLVGLFDVPASAPHSYANRGFYVVSVTNVQGLASQAAANAAAQAVYAQDPSTYSWLSFESTPDPRHDTFNIVGTQLAVGGAITNYREQGWRLPCAPGAKMIHDLRGIYS